ncbi:MAG TPA: C25 family cysteine peptidase [Thermoguttaceae bacterium]|nr:C25 family cysteine peptidase [Thermoguttaceae bacterium]
MHTALLVLLGLVAQGNPGFTATAPTAAKNAVVAVCPDDFRPALAPWVAFRKAEGYDVRVVSNAGTSKEIRRRVRAAVPGGRPKFLVLVGDVPTDMDGKSPAGADASEAARCVPAPYAKAKVNLYFGSEPRMPNDAWYADWDDDGLPDVAQGRLTADTPEELGTMVAKILAYERSTDFRAWRRQLNFVAGVGGFGPMADAVIESSARYLLTTGIPADCRVQMTQANWRAAYCPDPRRINQTTIDRLNDGAFFWTYIGHGRPQRLGAMHVPGRRYGLLSTEDVARLRAQHGPSIALFLACYTGALDSRPDCLAEELLREPGGPVGIVSSSRVAMPYAMAVMGMEMMDACFKQRVPTLGEAVLVAKRNLVNPGKPTEVRAMLDSIASLVSPSALKMTEERAEHVVLFNLFGDPCLRLRYPESVTLSAATDKTNVKKLVVECDSPVAGRATIELVRPLGVLGFPAPRRTAYPASPDELDEYDLIYKRANDGRVSGVEQNVATGPFLAELTLPGNLAGTFQVRVFVEGKDGFGSGSTNVRLGPQQPTADSRQQAVRVGQAVPDNPAT